MQCFMQSSSYAPVNVNPCPQRRGAGVLVGKVVSFDYKFVPDDGRLGRWLTYISCVAALVFLTRKV
jgi:hypothetical protein